MRRSHRVHRDVNSRSNKDRAVVSGAGTTVINEMPVPVNDGELSAGHRQRSGVISQVATAAAAVPAQNAGRGLEEPRVPLTAAGRLRQRIKWTREMNISVLRAYYRSTNVETEREGFRRRMHAEWLTIYPDSLLSEQNICNQLASIQKRKVFSTDEENQIKNEIKQDLQLNKKERGIELDDSIRPQEDSIVVLQEQTAQTVEDENIALLRKSYECNKLCYGGIPIKSRPHLPKIQCNSSALETISVVDTFLNEDLASDTPLEKAACLVYCGALTVSNALGVELEDKKKLAPQNDFTRKNKKTPVWIRRIEDKINKARREISHIAEYLNKEKKVSRKVILGVRSIARRLKMKMSDRGFDNELRIEDDRLKQRIAILGSRIRRYNKSAKRRKENLLFFKDQQKFYRQLEQENRVDQPQKPPNSEDMSRYWAELWSVPKEHADDAYWLQDEINACRDIPMMNPIHITLADVQTAIKKTQNWKSPGVDGIHNFWWKYFKSTHLVLSCQFQKALEDPTVLPQYLTLGMTYMLPKTGNLEDPKNYRPISCLPTLYKLLTSILAEKIYDHMITNKILADEQKGCCKGAQGCKELLVIDSVVAQQVRKKKHNISLGWVDYKKAFDSVPHSWLVKILEIYKVDKSLTELLSACMQTWRTELYVGQRGTGYKTGELSIKRGIFQGDSLSPLWFCIALNPLSRMLRSSGYGYILKKNPDLRMSHQFYMDDLKLYAKNPDQLTSMFEIVQGFSNTICMEFGLDKCAVVHARRGDVQNYQRGLKLMDGTSIPELGSEDSYKYLGLQQLLGTRDKDSRKQIEKKVLSRVHKVCKSSLSSRNKIEAINTWAIPVAMYSFGVIKWSDTSLQAFDRKIRTTLTKHRLHHPRSSIHRLYLSRHVGGRGLLSLEVMCRRQETKLRNYFLNVNMPLHKAICSLDSCYTPLQLASAEYENIVLNPEQRIIEWRSKELHGRFAAAISAEYVDLVRSTEWLRTSNIFGETEGFIFAIQDQVVHTRAYERHIMGQNISDRCRLCKQTVESVMHISGGCSSLAQKDYLERHNSLAKVVHQAIAKRFGLIEEELPYYKCTPEQILQNDVAKIYWDTACLTDRAVEANRPDLVVFDKKGKSAIIIDIAVPLDDNIVKTVAEKQRKYCPLATELKDIYELRSVEVVPVVISTNGLVPKGWDRVKEKLMLQERHLRAMQKAAVLGTASIVRKVLSLQS